MGTPYANPLKTWQIVVGCLALIFLIFVGPIIFSSWWPQP